MSKNNTDNDVFKKERLRLLPYIIVLCVIAYLINMGLWALDTVAILTIVVVLVVSKLFLVIFRFFNYDKWKSRRFSFLLPFSIILIVAFLLDYGAVRDLWLYRFGAETQGNVINFIRTKTDSIVYKFSVDGVSFQTQQEVSNSYLENLRIGSQVSIKYNPDNPKFSFLIDNQQLKARTIFILLIGFGIIGAMFANEIHEKINSFLNNNFRAKKPA